MSNGPTSLDPWGNEYRYVLDADTDAGYDLISDGPDGRAETEDDIYMSRLNEYWKRRDARSGRAHREG